MIHHKHPKLRINFWTLCGICGLMFGCAPIPNQTTPNAPKENYIYSKVQIQNDKHKSVVSLPIELSLVDVAKQLNTQVQGLIYEDNSYTDDNNDDFKTKVWKRAPIKVEIRDSLLYYTIPLKIWAEKGYRFNILGQTIAGYKDTEFAIDLKFMTSFGIKPDWTVQTNTASNGFDWVTKPSIRVSGFDIPITGIVSKKISENLGTLAKSIDDNIKQNFNIKPYILQAWNLLREPRLLSEEYQTWLLINPTDILMTPFVLNNNSIKATIAIRGNTQTLTGSKPSITSANNIPPLSIVKEVPHGFEIGLVASLPYTAATQLAATKFVNQTFEAKEGKYKVTVTSIDIYGQNEKLIIKAGLSGDVNGVIYLKGIPTYDPQTRLLTLKNLDYDLDTKNILIKGASWLLQSKFAKQMEEQFAFPLGNQMTETQKAIQQQLTNRVLTKGVTLNGHLNSLQPDQVYLTPEGAVAVIVAKGDLQIRINGLL
jgi:Domain of unknown function (DUF4403)